MPRTYFFYCDTSFLKNATNPFSANSFNGEGFKKDDVSKILSSTDFSFSNDLSEKGRFATSVAISVASDSFEPIFLSIGNDGMPYIKFGLESLAAAIFADKEKILVYSDVPPESIPGLSCFEPIEGTISSKLVNWDSLAPLSTSATDSLDLKTALSNLSKCSELSVKAIMDALSDSISITESASSEIIKINPIAWRFLPEKLQFSTKTINSFRTPYSAYCTIASSPQFKNIDLREELYERNISMPFSYSKIMESFFEDMNSQIQIKTSNLVPPTVIKLFNEARDLDWNEKLVFIASKSISISLTHGMIPKKILSEHPDILADISSKNGVDDFDYDFFKHVLYLNDDEAVARVSKLDQTKLKKALPFIIEVRKDRKLENQLATAIIEKLPMAYSLYRDAFPNDPKFLAEFLKCDGFLPNPEWNSPQILSLLPKEEQLLIPRTNETFFIKGLESNDLIPEAWKTDPDFYVAAGTVFYRTNPPESVIQAISNNESMCARLVHVHPKNFSKLPKKARTEKLAALLLNRHTDHLHQIPNEFWLRPSFGLELIKLNPSVSNEVPIDFFSNKNFVLSLLKEIDEDRLSSAVFKRVPKALEWIETSLLSGTKGNLSIQFESLITKNNLEAFLSLPLKKASTKKI